jgi:hypothetical protein
LSGDERRQVRNHIPTVAGCRSLTDSNQLEVAHYPQLHEAFDVHHVFG